MKYGYQASFMTYYSECREITILNWGEITPLINRGPNNVYYNLPIRQSRHVRKAPRFVQATKLGTINRYNWSKRKCENFGKRLSNPRIFFYKCKNSRPRGIIIYSLIPRGLIKLLIKINSKFRNAREWIFSYINIRLLPVHN